MRLRLGHAMRPATEDEAPRPARAHLQRRRQVAVVHLDRHLARRGAPPPRRGSTPRARPPTARAPRSSPWSPAARAHARAARERARRRLVYAGYAASIDVADDRLRRVTGGGLPTSAPPAAPRPRPALANARAPPTPGSPAATPWRSRRRRRGAEIDRARRIGDTLAMRAHQRRRERRLASSRGRLARSTRIADHRSSPTPTRADRRHRRRRSAPPRRRAASAPPRAPSGPPATPSPADRRGAERAAASPLQERAPPASKHREHAQPDAAAYPDPAPACAARSRPRTAWTKAAISTPGSAGHSLLASSCHEKLEKEVAVCSKKIHTDCRAAELPTYSPQGRRLWPPIFFPALPPFFAGFPHPPHPLNNRAASHRRSTPESRRNRSLA